MDQRPRDKVNRKSAMQKNNKPNNKEYCHQSIEKALQSKWPIDKYGFPSDKFYDTNLIFLEKDKVANNHINDSKYRKTKKSEKNIYPILKGRKESYDKRNTLILTPIVEEFFIHITCIILQNILKP